MSFRPAFYLSLVISLVTSLALATTEQESLAYLQRLIEKNQVSSVEEFLRVLPKKLRSSFTLMKESGSIQGATPENPRVLMYSQTGRLVFSFNGNSEQRGGDAVEVMQFVDKTKDFEFFEIDFSAEKPHFSNKNPKKCLSCHRKDPRPNWEPYEGPDMKQTIWDGAYAGHDDRFINDEERQNLKDFIETAKNHPRYSYLEGLSEDSLVRFDKRNTTLTQRLNVLGKMRMADRIKKTPNYSQYKFALLGILLCDISDNGSLNDKNSVGGFFPEGMSFQEAPWQTETYAGYQYVLKNLRAVFESRGISTDSWFFNRVPGDHNNMGTPYSASILAAELVRDDPELLAFTDGLVDGNYYGVSFQSVGIKRPEEDNFFFTSCGALQQRSLEALKGLSCESAEQYSASEIIQDGQKLVEAAMRQQDHAPPKALRLCIGCHDNPTGNNVGPAISFNNREKLKQHFSGAKGEEHYKDLVRRINEDRRSTERMPPTSVLTDQEKIDIMSYINRLFN